MSNPFIVLGDKTDHGGTVVGVSSQTDIDGKPVARVGDQVSCPKCKGTFPIAAGDSTVIIDGRPVARHGDKTACGATLLSGQSRVFVDAGSSGAAKHAATTVGALSLSQVATNIGGTADSAGALMTENLRRGRGSARGEWRVADVLKRLCPQDKAVVDEMAQTQITASDEIYFDDLRFDGREWVVDRFQAGGTQGGGNIGLLRSASPEAAATTIYHEVWHKKQPASMRWVDKEVEAYYETEQWTIRQGMSGQQEGFRTRNANGNWTADRYKIAAYVRAKYPVSTDSTKPFPVERDENGDVVLSDGSTRPPQRGDRISGEEMAKNKRSIPASAWKCPGPEEEARRSDGAG